METGANFTSVATTTTSVAGSGATFNVEKVGSKYFVTLSSGGQDYTRLDTLTVLGTNVGGSTTTHDITITATTVNATTGAIEAFDFHGNANGAVYIVEASVISYMERLKKVKVDFSVDVLPYYMGRIFTYYNGLYHRDIGNIRSYELAQIETDSLYREIS